MIPQNGQMVNYLSSMSSGMTIPQEIEHKRKLTGGIFHDAVLGISMILLPFLVGTFLNSINVQAEYNIQQIRAEVMEMEKGNSILKLEVARLDAPVRIQKIAETKLGMKFPVRNVYGASDKSASTAHAVMG